MSRLYFRLWLCLVLAAGSVVSAAAQSGSGGVRLTGEGWSDAAATLADSELLFGGYTALRLDVNAGDRQTAKVEGSVIFRLLYGLPADTLRDQAEDLLGDPLAGYLTGTEGALFHAEVKKLYLSVYAERFDLSVGRMILNYGRGTVFSPVDLFAGIDLTDLSFGRTGTDAARLQIPLGAVSGLEAAVTLPYGIQELTGGIRGFGNLAGWDFGLSLFRDGSSLRGGGEGSGVLVCGLDFKGDLVLGFSGEAVVRFPWDGEGLSAEGVTASLMAGVDYSVGGKWIFDLEYLANLGEGSRTGTFRGDHTLFGSVTFQPDLLTSLVLYGIVRLEDPSWQVMFTATRSVAARVNLTGYLSWSGGDMTGSLPADPPQTGTAGIRVSVLF